MTRRVEDRGPLLPGEASAILTFVAGLIGLGGTLTLVGVALVLIGPLFGAEALALSARTVLGVVMVTGAGVAYCLTGLWLYQGRRRGAYLALGALALDVLSVLGRASRPDVFDLLLPMAALVGVVLAWPHLSEAGRDIDGRLRITPRAG